MKSTALLLLLALLAGVTAGTAQPAPVTGSLTDYAAHRQAVNAVEKIRDARRISESDFIRLAAEPGTVVLDARSAAMFQRLHVKGAVNLSFPDFTAETLAAAIPAKTTRVLIYCNNNFNGSRSAFPVKALAAALNISTFVALHTYGYDNVYELGPLLEVATTRLQLAGREVTDRPGAFIRD